MLVTALASPLLLTVTAPVFELDQEQVLRVCVVPSLNVPVALSCTVCPLLCKAGADGLMFTPVSVGLTKNPWQLLMTRRRTMLMAAARNFVLLIDTFTRKDH